MQRTELIHNTFAGGLLSPKMYGRTDVARYHAGLRQLENFIVFPQGGITRRPGTFYVAETKTSSTASRLVPFVASSETAYILEFGNQYIRFYTGNAQVQSGGVAYEVATPWNDGEVFELQFAQSVDVLYIVHPDHAPRCLNHFASANWTLTEFDYQDGPYLDENEKDDGTIDEDITIQVSATDKDTTGVTVTASSALFQGNSDDIGRVVRIRHELQWGCIKITSALSTTQATGTITKSFLYTTPSKHWRLGAWCDYTGWPQCVTFHEQRLWFARNSKKGQTLWGSVVGDFTNFNPSVEVAGANYITDGEFNATDLWTEGVGWSLSSTPGQATATTATSNLTQNLAIIEGRKYRVTYTVTRSAGSVKCAFGVAAGPDSPARSASGTYVDYFTYPTAGATSIFFGFKGTGFTGSIDDVIIEDVTEINVTGDDSSLALTISSDTLDAIAWLLSGTSLLAGTIGGVYSVSAHSGAGLTPTNFKIKRENTYPAKTLRPVSFGNSALYVQNGGLVVRDVGYNFQTDSFNAADLTIFSDMVTESGIVDVARQMAPFNIFWAVRGDGKLIGLTYEKDQQVLAWHTHDTEGTFESVAVIPGTLEDQVWFIVKRLINGSYVRYVEYMDKLNFDSLYTAHCVDCGVYTTGTGMTSVSGLSHLEAEVVQVCGDGIEQADATVSSGAITCTSCNYVHVGLEYDSVLETMDIDPGGGPQSIMAKQKRIVDSTFLFYRTSKCQGGYITGTSSNGYAYNLNIIVETDETVIVLEGGQDSAFAAGSPYAAVEHVDNFDFEDGRIFTGKKRMSYPGGWDDTATVYAVQYCPLPLAIMAIVTTLVVGDR